MWDCWAHCMFFCVCICPKSPVCLRLILRYNKHTDWDKRKYVHHWLTADLVCLKPVLPTLRFSREFGLVFYGFAGFFWRLAGCLFLGLFWLKFALFFADFCIADCFFSNFMAILRFQFTAKRNLGVFLCKFAHFGLVFFGFASLFLYLTILLVYFFLIFLPNARWACFFCWISHFGLVFQNSLLVFRKSPGITAWSTALSIDFKTADDTQ